MIIGSNIVNLSLGASRVMILKSKADYVPDAESCPSGGRLYFKITLPHNSLFVLGWKSNRDFLHSIRADKRMPSLKSTDELICREQRISLTFRTIATFIRGPYNDVEGEVGSCNEQRLIVGQGARKRRNSDIRLTQQDNKEPGDSLGEGGNKLTEVSADDALTQSLQMINAFSCENRTSHFDWDEHYGQGFDIINFSFMNNRSRSCDQEGL